MSDSKNSLRGPGFFGGVVIGGVIGLITGMVLAPKSGDETRTMFSERGQELRDKADDFFAAARERMAAADRGGRRSRRPEYPFDDLDLDDEDL